MQGLSTWFSSPGWLWLLIPSAILVGVDLVRRWPKAGVGRRIGGALARGLILAGLVVALADPRYSERDEVAHVIFVVDRSASIPDEALQQALSRVEALRQSLEPEVRTALVLFDATPEVAVAPGEPWQLPDPIRAHTVDATHLDAALSLALGLIPADDGGEIVLLSDGRGTDVDGQKQALRQASQQGIPIHAVVVEPGRGDPAVSAVVLASDTPRPGSTLEGTVELDGADTTTRGVLVVKLGDTPILHQDVEIPAGESLRVPFVHELDARTEPGAQSVTAELQPHQADPRPENNRAQTTVVVGAPPFVRIFAGEAHDADSLARALRAERMDVQVVKTEDIRPEHEDLDEVDLVVLANAPAASIGGSRALQPTFLESLTRFVDAGGGLMVLGGPMAYDMGGYGSSPLARVLPVELDPVDPEVQAGATIIIILDRSGSMAAMVGFSKTKMDLADEGAAASIKLLRPFDRVGVMSVTESVRWDVPTQSVRDPAALERKVMAIRSEGGGIFVYTALAAADKALEGASTPLKHVILFSDAADSEEKVKGVPFGPGAGPTAEDLARKMRERGITTSVIGIGTEEDIDTPFLKDLARSGGGRFYLTADATKLRALFVEETERLVDTSLHETVFQPALQRPHPIVAGIDYGLGPPLRGYQELESRPTAEVVLTATEDHPLLTTWRYGLGQVVAWSSDAGPRWSENWLGWSGYAKQWTQAARFALRSRKGDDTAVEVAFDQGQARVRVARRDGSGLSLDEGRLHAVVEGQGENLKVALSSVEPGLWEGLVDTEPGHSYTLQVRGEDDEVLASQTFAPPPSAERRHRTADVARLRNLSKITSGRLDPEELDPATAPGVTTKVHRLWPWALLLCLLLLPIDALLRRPARVL